jgi:hypothetical protein
MNEKSLYLTSIRRGPEKGIFFQTILDGHFPSSQEGKNEIGKGQPFTGFCGREMCERPENGSFLTISHFLLWWKIISCS